MPHVLLMSFKCSNEKLVGLYISDSMHVSPQYIMHMPVHNSPSHTRMCVNVTTSHFFFTTWTRVDINQDPL